MGIVEETMETESGTKKWVISGIQFMTPLKPIYTKKGIKKGQPREEEEENEGEENESCMTPTTPESKIPVLLSCPGAPKKRKAISRSHCNEIKGFFEHPDLGSVFLRCVERG